MTLLAGCTIPWHQSNSSRVPIRDLGKVSEWCDLWGMKLNPSKTKTMSLQVTQNAPPLTIGGTVLKGCDDLVMLGETFDSKMTFEKDLRLVSRAASLDEVLASVSLYVTFLEMLSGFCPARFEVLSAE